MQVFDFRFFSQINVPLVFHWGRFEFLTMTLAINLLPVTRTRTRIGENRRYLRPSMLDKAADGVIGTAMKSCIHKHPTHLDQSPWGGQNYIMSFCLEVVFAAPDQGVWGAFAPFPMTISAALANFGGWRLFWRKSRPLPPIQFTLEKFICGVIDICEQFIAGVVDTSDNIIVDTGQK